MLFLPVVTTLVAVAVVWRYLYHPRFGLLNQALAALGIAPIDWLGDPRWAMPAIILHGGVEELRLQHARSSSPACRASPSELYEAARARRRRGLARASATSRCRCWRRPSLFVGVMTMIGHFQLFAEPYVMTQGGPPRATLIVVLLMYEEGFRWWNMGYAAAIAFVLFASILAARRLLQLRLQRGGSGA